MIGSVRIRRLKLKNQSLGQDGEIQSKIIKR